ncbi:hypothetical protein PVT67_06315 [Gallaecimonas kandeliae]|uniref:hypothetical protein n=1 Tax=Gallaecimonas kandeliae TaxID=3029055 RepID=UPI002649B003|nr:hypothetical protein [Gallaecimonas kandeliae]WKE66847.1 hypothetical protein PVT67_06315 [Gallaecimonas kandeliae]
MLFAQVAWIGLGDASAAPVGDGYNLSQPQENQAVADFDDLPLLPLSGPSTCNVLAWHLEPEQTPVVALSDPRYRPPARASP